MAVSRVHAFTKKKKHKITKHKVAIVTNTQKYIQRFNQLITC